MKIKIERCFNCNHHVITLVTKRWEDWYGHKLFIAVDEMYHFGLVNDNTFDKEFFEGWS